MKANCVLSRCLPIMALGALAALLTTSVGPVALGQTKKPKQDAPIRKLPQIADPTKKIAPVVDPTKTVAPLVNPKLPLLSVIPDLAVEKFEDVALGGGKYKLTAVLKNVGLGNYAGGGTFAISRDGVGMALPTEAHQTAKGSDDRSRGGDAKAGHDHLAHVEQTKDVCRVPRGRGRMSEGWI